MSILDQIMAYEDGEQTEEEYFAMFAELVKTGLAWQLQGVYGRTAVEGEQHHLRPTGRTGRAGQLADRGRHRPAARGPQGRPGHPRLLHRRVDRRREAH
jgi:hypothetical protein